MLAAPIPLTPGKTWPVDTKWFDRCTDPSFAAQAGDEKIDVVGGCVFGALKNGDVPGARDAWHAGNLNQIQAKIIYDMMVDRVGKAVADQVVTGAGAPWYKNWRYLVPLGVGLAALVGAVVYSRRRKRR